MLERRDRRSSRAWNRPLGISNGVVGHAAAIGCPVACVGGARVWLVAPIQIGLTPGQAHSHWLPHHFAATRIESECRKSDAYYRDTGCICCAFLLVPNAPIIDQSWKGKSSTAREPRTGWRNSCVGSYCVLRPPRDRDILTVQPRWLQTCSVTCRPKTKFRLALPGPEETAVHPLLKLALMLLKNFGCQPQVDDIRQLVKWAQDL